MQLSKSCPLIVSDLYFYDFQSCFYELLRSIGWDMSGIPIENKFERNKAIGMLQRNNPNLAKFLNDGSERLVDYYINKNEITAKDIILRQKDGMIIKKKLKVNDDTMPLDLRGIVSKMIISVRRSAYLAVFSTGKVSVKGIGNKPLDVTFYNAFRNLNYANKKELLKGIAAIRQRILTGTDCLWYAREEDGKYYVPILGMGQVTLSKSAIKNMLDPKEIDRRFLWEEYVWPFAQSVLLYCQ